MLTTLFLFYEDLLTIEWFPQKVISINYFWSRFFFNILRIVFNSLNFNTFKVLLLLLKHIPVYFVSQCQFSYLYTIYYS